MRPALTYAEVGATAGVLPSGYDHVSHRVCIGEGLAAFDAAVETLFSWNMHRRAGLTIDEAQPRVALDDDVRVGWAAGPVRLTAPCRVVRVVDEPNRKGFAYGTLPGHPEVGEESFIIDLDDAGGVWFEVTAFSRPARWYSRLGSPVSRLVQRRITRRYLKAFTP